MNTEITETATETPKKASAKRKKAKKRAKPVVRAPKDADRPVYDRAGDLSGISATKCPDGCTADRCVISTVGQCKHPYKSGDGGCGPITMANRARAKKLIKHQKIDADRM